MATDIKIREVVTILFRDELTHEMLSRIESKRLKGEYVHGLRAFPEGLSLGARKLGKMGIQGSDEPA